MKKREGGRRNGKQLSEEGEGNEIRWGKAGMDREQMRRDRAGKGEEGREGGRVRGGQGERVDREGGRERTEKKREEMGGQTEAGRE